MWSNRLECTSHVSKSRLCSAPLLPWLPPPPAFVSDNARRLLSLDAPSVLPVSSKAALRAKLECGSAVHSGAMDSLADDLLQEHPGWQASRWGWGFTGGMECVHMGIG